MPERRVVLVVPYKPDSGSSVPQMARRKERLAAHGTVSSRFCKLGNSGSIYSIPEITGQKCFARAVLIFHTGN